MRAIKYVLCALCVLHGALPAWGQTLTREEQAEFLQTARVVASRQTSKGVTNPWRLTLTDGTFTHDAHFQSIDQQRSVQEFGRGRRAEFNFVDSWRFNVAGHRLAVLLGIPDMVPVSVERGWNRKNGAFTWWVDDVLMDDETRRKTEAQAPDKDAWTKQDLRMRVFTQLVYDTDRNQGNVLITKDWRIVMIDFTRAFRVWKQLPAPTTILRRCDRALLAAMRALTKDQLRKTMGHYMTTFEVDGLLARRDIIVKHFDELIAKTGEANVLY